MTPSLLARVLPTLAPEKATVYAPLLAQAMRDAGIVTLRQRAAFIAQCAHESADFRHLEELGETEYFTRLYEGRADLGNTQPGDGARFHGRGVIQLTGRNNYDQASHALYGDDRLVKSPHLAAQPEAAFVIATWFWASRNLNALAEAGDFRQVTLRINGGLTGYADRVERYERALQALQ